MSDLSATLREMVSWKILQTSLAAGLVGLLSMGCFRQIPIEAQELMTQSLNTQSDPKLGMHFVGYSKEFLYFNVVGEFDDEFDFYRQFPTKKYYHYYYDVLSSAPKTDKTASALGVLTQPATTFIEITGKEKIIIGDHILIVHGK